MKPGVHAAPKSRNRRLVTGISTSVVSRGLMIAGPLLLVPITYRYMGKPAFGVWATFSALTTMMLWADFGLGNGLMTRLAHTVAVEDHAAGRRVVAAAYALLTGIAVVGSLMLLAAAPLIPWHAIVNAPPSVPVEGMGLACFVGFLVNMPLALVQRVQYALQEVTRCNVYLLINPVAAVVGATVCVYLHADLTTLAWVLSLSSVLSSFAATLDIVYRHRWVVPRLSDFELGSVKPLLSVGFGFLAVQIGSLIGLNVDNLIIARIGGAASVADYSVASRLVTMLGLLVSVACLPLWPANADALARGDLAWVRLATRKMTQIGVAVMSLLGVCLVSAGPLVVYAWVGRHATVSVPLLAGMVVTWILIAGASPAFMVQNAAAITGYQAAAWLLFCILTIPAKILIGRTLGIQWVPWVGAIMYALIMVPGAIRGFTIAIARYGDVPQRGELESV